MSFQDVLWSTYDIRLDRSYADPHSVRRLTPPDGPRPTKKPVRVTPVPNNRPPTRKIPTVKP